MNLNFFSFYLSQTVGTRRRDSDSTVRVGRHMILQASSLGQLEAALPVSTVTGTVSDFKF